MSNKTPAQRLITHIAPRDLPVMAPADCDHHATLALTDDNGNFRGFFCRMCLAHWYASDIQVALALYEQERKK